MKTLFQLLIAITAFTTVTANANLRDKIKERVLERQKEKPAPAVQAQPTKIDQPGDSTLSLEHGGRTRIYKLHVPKSYDGKKAMPLLVVLHGGGGDMTIQSTEEFYHQISKSESRGFIAAFPNGVSPFQSGKLASWNAGKCCGKARDEKVDDVGFIRKLVEKAESQLNIDKTKIYATGMSNGGMMAYRLACDGSEVFKAIASVAGTDNTLDCKPAKPISVLHIHARDDDHVLYDGGAGAGAFKDPSQITEFFSVPKTIAKWKTQNGCTEEKPTNILTVKGATCDLYSKCRSNTRLELCVNDEGGHSWPGGKKPSPFAKGNPSKAISANDVMWDFFDSL